MFTVILLPDARLDLSILCIEFTLCLLVFDLCFPCDPSTCSPYRAHVPNLGPEQGQGQGSTASRVCNNCFGLKISKLTQLAPKDMNGLIQDFIQKETSKENDSHTSHKKGATNENTAQCRASKKKEKRAELENVQFQLLEEPKYSKAYRRMRCIIPPFIATLNLHSLISTGLPKAVAERIWSKRSRK